MNNDTNTDNTPTLDQYLLEANRYGPSITHYLIHPASYANLINKYGTTDIQTNHTLIRAIPDPSLIEIKYDDIESIITKYADAD